MAPEVFNQAAYEDQVSGDYHNNHESWAFVGLPSSYEMEVSSAYPAAAVNETITVSNNTSPLTDEFACPESTDIIELCNFSIANVSLDSHTVTSYNILNRAATGMDGSYVDLQQLPVNNLQSFMSDEDYQQVESPATDKNLLAEYVHESGTQGIETTNISTAESPSENQGVENADTSIADTRTPSRNQGAENAGTSTADTPSRSLERSKRKVISTPEEQNIMKAAKRQSEHVILPGCEPSKCKKSCSIKFSSAQREMIHSKYWSLGFEAKYMFIQENMRSTSTKRKTIETDFQGSSRRKKTNYFSFKNPDGANVDVCRSFFLNTLGYTATNNTIIKNASRFSADGSIDDRRGKQPKPQVDITILKNHIESLSPCVSHYRRKHAPNRRYLPSDISISAMYNDFQENFPDFHCSYSSYRRTVSEMNISLTNLGHEECESCEQFNQHDGNHKKDQDPNCKICEEWRSHIQKAKAARDQYRIDADSNEWTPQKICVSVDLQKVIMLPRMDTFKRVVFTRRIIAFNESFVPVGQNQRFIGPAAVLWHEGISGRKKEDICSVFHKFLSNERDAQFVRFWVDNCSAQNKNWTLFSMFVFLINSKEIFTNQIELCYFEPRHTFTSCDSFHHQVENSLDEMGKIYDFEDFSRAIKSVKMKNSNALEMLFTDFRTWKDHKSMTKIQGHKPARPYLNEIVRIKFIRGNMNMFISKSFEGDYEELDFVTKSFKKAPRVKPKDQAKPRGVPLAKKKDIIEKLCPLMPESRRQFWKKLETSEAVDLVTNRDDILSDEEDELNG